MNNFFVNTIVTALQRPEWVLLLHRFGHPFYITLLQYTSHSAFRIGIDAMIHLLTETSMFFALPNGCLCQMTGPILLYTAPQNERDRTAKPSNKRKRTTTESEESDRLHKRLKVGSTASFSRPPPKLRMYVCVSPPLALFDDACRRSPMDVSFARQRMFYARPSLTRAGSIVVGLPLNRKAFDIST